MVQSLQVEDVASNESHTTDTHDAQSLDGHYSKKTATPLTLVEPENKKNTLTEKKMNEKQIRQTLQQ